MGNGRREYFPIDIHKILMSIIMNRIINLCILLVFMEICYIYAISDDISSFNQNSGTTDILHDASLAASEYNSPTPYSTQFPMRQPSVKPTTIMSEYPTPIIYDHDISSNVPSYSANLPTIQPIASPTTYPTSIPSPIPSLSQSSPPSTIQSTYIGNNLLSITQPYDMIFDRQDNLYIASDDGLARRDAIDLTVSILASNASFHGIAINFIDTMLYMTNYYEKIINRYDVTSKKYDVYYIFTSLEAASHPVGIAIDHASHLYVTFDGHHSSSIIKIDASSQTSSIFLPSASYYAGGIYIDRITEKMYISNMDDHRITCINMTSSTMMIYAGNGEEVIYGVGKYDGDGGLAIDASLFSPHGIVSTRDGLFIADTGNGIIRYVDHHSMMISLYAGIPSSHGYNGDHLAADHMMLRYPHAVAIDSHSFVYIADTLNNMIRGVYPAAQAPSDLPTAIPTAMPSSYPTTASPSYIPTYIPTSSPSFIPSAMPTSTLYPTNQPTISHVPTYEPTANLTQAADIIIPHHTSSHDDHDISIGSILMMWMLYLLIGSGVCGGIGYYIYYHTDMITGKKKLSYQQVEMVDQFDDAFTEEDIEGV